MSSVVERGIPAVGAVLGVVRPHRVPEVAHREGDLLAGLDRRLGQRHDVGIHRDRDLRDRLGRGRPIPAVFHVMTRMLLSVFAGSVSVPSPASRHDRDVRDHRDRGDQRDREGEAAHRAGDREQQRDDQQRRERDRRAGRGTR